MTGNGMSDAKSSAHTCCRKVADHGVRACGWVGDCHRDGTLTYSAVQTLMGQGKLLPTSTITFSAPSLSSYAYGTRPRLHTRPG
jgi:hypothetical protein